jgi:hypothetical protein
MNKFFLFLLALLCLATAVVVVYFDPLGRQNRAGLRIEYSKDVAQVFLNEQYIGLAPLVKEDLQAGDYLLKIQPEDPQLSKFTVPLHLEKGTLTVVIFNPAETIKYSSSTIYELYQRDDNLSSVSFESFPENALLSFNGGQSEFTPLQIDNVSEGEHHFSISLPSYEAQDHSFYTLKGYETKVTINLAKHLLKEIETPPPSSASAVITEKVQAELEEEASSSSAAANEASTAAETTPNTENTESAN